MLIFSSIVTLISILIYFFPQYYISELAISFLPYIIIIILLIIIFSFINFRKSIKLLIPAIEKPNKLRGVIFLFSTIIFFLYSRQFNHFYNLPVSEFTASTNGEIKILYANIHKNNTDYTGIQQTIQKVNPDLILFVEFSENHYNHLQAFLKSSYPYINSTTRSEKFIGSMVFSKYEIKNWANDFQQGTWRYAYFSILPSSGSKYYFYLIHTSSPDSYTHFVMRNKQLTSFLNDFQTHQQSYRSKQDKVIVLGDFNVSPWSSYYTNFQNGLGNSFLNISRKFPILFTWKLFQFPVLLSHIDHIWTNSSNAISRLETINLPGSDHNGYVFSLTE